LSFCQIELRYANGTEGVVAGQELGHPCWRRKAVFTDVAAKELVFKHLLVQNHAALVQGCGRRVLLTIFRQRARLLIT
jgi:hypothetical protein